MELPKDITGEINKCFTDVILKVLKGKLEEYTEVIKEKLNEDEKITSEELDDLLSNYFDILSLEDIKRENKAKTSYNNTKPATKIANKIVTVVKKSSNKNKDDEEDENPDNEEPDSETEKDDTICDYIPRGSKDECGNLATCSSETGEPRCKAHKDRKSSYAKTKGTKIVTTKNTNKIGKKFDGNLSSTVQQAINTRIEKRVISIKPHPKSRLYIDESTNLVFRKIKIDDDNSKVIAYGYVTDYNSGKVQPLDLKHILLCTQNNYPYDENHTDADIDDKNQQEETESTSDTEDYKPTDDSSITTNKKTINTNSIKPTKFHTKTKPIVSNISNSDDEIQDSPKRLVKINKINKQ